MVKKIFLMAFILIIAIAIIGCVKVEKTETMTETTDSSDDSSDTATDSDSDLEDSDSDDSDSSKLPSDLVSLMEKGENNINNAKYIYRYDPFSQERHGLKIKSNLIKYELPEEQRFYKHELFDTIYLDTNLKTAVAYCEHPGRYKCLDPNKPYDVDYSEFVNLNDGRFLYSYWYDLAENNAGSFKKMGSQQVFSRNTYVFVVVSNKVSYTIFLDAFSGMVLRVVEGPEGSSTSSTDNKVTSYEPEGLGNVKDTDVVHQKISI